MRKYIFPIILISFFSWVSCSSAPAPRQISISTAPMLGQDGARTELIIFSDFQCAFCKKAAREIHRLLRVHPNKLKVYFKYYPLSYHPYGQKAAQAAEAAKRQGKFWEMHDIMFDLLLEVPEFKKLNIKDFPGFKVCISGAAPFAEEPFKAMEAIVGKGNLIVSLINAP